MNKEPCLLWERTRDLAKDRGFDLHGSCPVDASCDGSYCFYLSSTGDGGPQRLESFHTRQEQTDYLKLCILRQEIKRMMPAREEDIDKKGGPIA